ncbi:hypothetical protein COCCADRAFT_35303 [Bipolaris zeicola 26-R-13]|uniref:Uncharacterized protein n=1 Tax=Cochliobolus carbonum (strain 26-R-13) TaxID=930089 RepID=W6YC58_COCC2|nr:uncharacterized protein COCCADRAFT_35303 [Bipolaris zeicola 26-R-13]EUC35208.1 hypothetical protein COCCADRAFT_35303 [Bipolaris zeicola 26-R-13]
MYKDEVLHTSWKSSHHQHSIPPSLSFHRSRRLKIIHFFLQFNTPSRPFLKPFNMHPSTIAAILAFTAGMTVNAVPVVRPEGTPEPPADRLRTTVGHTQARPQLSELAEDEFTIPSIGKRDHPIRPLPACNDSSEPSIGILCMSSDLEELINRPSNGIGRPSVLGPQVTKRDPQRFADVDDGRVDLGILVPPTLEELLERKKQAGFSKEKRQSGRPIRLVEPSGESTVTPEELEQIVNNYKQFRKEFGGVGAKEKRKAQVIDAGFGFDAGVTIDPSALTGRLKQLIPGQKEKRDNGRFINKEPGRLGWDPIPTIGDEVLRGAQNQKRDLSRVVDNVVGRIAPVVPGGVKQFIPGHKEKRDPQVIDAGFGFDAGVTIDPSTIADKVKQFIPGQKERRDPQVIDAGFGFDAGITIDPSTITDKLTQFIPGQKEKRDDMGADFGFGATPDSLVLPVRRPSQKVTRDAQIDAGVGFNAGITIDPIALPGHIKKLLPIQRTKRDPQGRGKGHVFGKIAEGVAGGIGAIADGLTIHQALQGKPA